jgi:glutamyl/glutaminyl-tRNA synthetase
VEKLIEIIDWIGIKFDEGPGSIRGTTNSAHPNENNKDVGNYGPYTQTERLDIYKKYQDELLAKGEAYPCFCTEERLTQMRADLEARKLPPRYDRTCRDISSGRSG